MEFYEESGPVQLSTFRRIDFDSVEEQPDSTEPKPDKYGFTGGVTKTVA